MLAIVSLVFFAIAAKFGYHQNVPGLGTAAALAVACLIFVFLPYFSEFSIFGFRGKLLDQKINEAEIALNRLKGVAVVVARLAYENLTYGNRMTSIPLKNKRDLESELREVLNSLSLGDDTLMAERKMFVDMHMFDIALFVERTMNFGIQEIDKRRPAARESDALRELAEELRTLVKSVDAQAVAKKSESEQFFATLEQGLETIDFSAASDLKDAFLSLVTEAESLCREMRIKNELTQGAIDYFDFAEAASDSPEAKWQRLNSAV